MIYLEKLEEAKKKKGRCWTGYKPKPGSVPYSKGSCVKEAYKLIGLALTDLEEGAAKEAGLSPKQYRRMMVGKRRALGNNPNPALARGFERGATEQLKKEQERKKKEAMKKNPNAADRYKDKTVTTTKTVPGDDLDYSTTLKTAVEGDVFTPQERRQESRDTKKSYRDEKRSRLKATRAENKLKKAEGKDNSKRTERLKIKADIARKKADDFSAASKRGSLSKKSGLAPGAGKAYLYDRDVSLGERSEPQQLEQARQEAIKQAEYDHAYRKRLKELEEAAQTKQLLKGKQQTPNSGLNYWDRYNDAMKRLQRTAKEPHVVSSSSAISCH